MITEQQLKELGYRRFQAGGIGAFQHAEFFMQKRFCDEEGIRYFVEFIHYPSFAFPNGVSMDSTWTCHLNINEPHCTFEQHRITDIAQAEGYAREVWEVMGRPYYERYEEQRA